MRALIDDARAALRNVRLSGVATAATTVSVAIAIGATTTLFSALNALAFKPLEVERADELYQIVLGTANASQLPSSVFDPLRADSALGPLVAATAGRYRVRVGTVTAPAEVLFASGELFDLLRVQPIIGRTFQPSDVQPGAPMVGVLGYAMWRDRFGRAASVLGATVHVQGAPVTIIGVAPPSFRGTHVGRRFDVVVPLVHVWSLMGLRPGGLWTVSVLGRRPPGQALAALSERLRVLQPELRRVAMPTTWRPESQGVFLAQPLTAIPASTGVPTSHSEQASTLVLLLAGSAFVLVIACVNVANALAAQHWRRSRELAVRRALGASPMRLARVPFLEALLLAVASAGAGAAVAAGCTELLVASLSSTAGELALDPRPDWRVFGGGALAVLMVALVTGLWPALAAARISARSLVRPDMASGRGARRTSTALAAAQLAISVVLVSGTALLVRSFVNVRGADPGFNSAGVWIADLAFGSRAVVARDRATAYERVRAALLAAPNVTAAGGVTVSPLAGNALVTLAEGPSEAHPVYLNRVTPGYFEAVSTRFQVGRDFRPNDDLGAPRVAIVNESLARRLFGDASALGQTTTRIAMATNTRVPLEIVGVVRDAAYLSVTESRPETLYVPLLQEPNPDGIFTVMVRGLPGVVLTQEQVRRAVTVHGVEDVALRSLDSQVSASWRRDEALMWLALAMSAVALTTAALGLFGVLTRRAETRRRELAVRAALGATPWNLRLLVWRDTAVIAVGGALSGVGLAYVSVPALRAWLFGVEPTDSVALGISAVALLLVSSVASYGPAERASRVDPNAVLRAE
ncbi:ABC transporter permease [Luteitalea sp.]|uniref:ABC transporter permease n=1 Tax=Luteitalea sp. TaxID=2004800 RepID=UPI0025BB1EF0|nr:ABC transporter permease [Luteitalea sp.]